MQAFKTVLFTLNTLACDGYDVILCVLLIWRYYFRIRLITFFWGGSTEFQQFGHFPNVCSPLSVSILLQETTEMLNFISFQNYFNLIQWVTYMTNCHWCLYSTFVLFNSQKISFLEQSAFLFEKKKRKRDWKKRGWWGNYIIYSGGNTTDNDFVSQT